MDDREKEIFERLSALETNRKNDQEAIKLLRESRTDRGSMYVAVISALIALASLVLRGR
jgi:hypothetical protein